MHASQNELLQTKSTVLLNCDHHAAPKAHHVKSDLVRHNCRCRVASNVLGSFMIVFPVNSIGQF